MANTPDWVEEFEDETLAAGEPGQPKPQQVNNPTCPMTGTNSCAGANTRRCPKC